MMKVGIRAANMPSQMEGVVLYDHLLKFYGGHTLAELKQAFDMAITGQLDIDSRDVKAYESFDCAYVSRIMNAYRTWAKQVYDRKEKAEYPLIDAVRDPNSDWREAVQILLDQYWEGNMNYLLVPAAVYDQLIFDNLLAPFDAYLAFMDLARQKLCNETQIELAKMPAQSEENYNVEIGKYQDHQRHAVRLAGLRSGALESEVILRAKQMTVKHFFQHLKIQETKILYTQQ